MDEMLLEKIDRAINDCRQQLAQDIIDLIAVRSVQGPPQPGAPFGIGTVLVMALQASIFQGVCRITRYEPRDIRHEDLADTLRNLLKKA